MQREIRAKRPWAIDEDTQEIFADLMTIVIILVYVISINKY